MEGGKQTRMGEKAEDDWEHDEAVEESEDDSEEEDCEESKLPEDQAEHTEDWQPEQIICHNIDQTYTLRRKKYAEK